jgi:hypothetical protein
MVICKPAGTGEGRQWHGLRLIGDAFSQPWRLPVGAIDRCAGHRLSPRHSVLGIIWTAGHRGGDVRAGGG